MEWHNQRLTDNSSQFTIESELKTNVHENFKAIDERSQPKHVTHFLRNLIVTLEDKIFREGN